VRWTPAPLVASDKEGNFTVAWMEAMTEFGASRIMSQRTAKTGGQLVTTVAEAGAGSGLLLSAIEATNPNHVFVYWEEVVDGASIGRFRRDFDEEGAGVGAPEEIFPALEW
jgi:hypothetical protein